MKKVYNKIKKSKSIIVLLILISCNPIQYYTGSERIELQNKESFFIQLTDGYNYDTVSLKINSRILFNKEIHKSVYSRSEDPIPDSVLMVDRNTFIKYDNDTLFLQILGSYHEIVTDFPYSSKLNIEVTVNHVKQEEVINLNNGRFINMSYVYRQMNNSDSGYRVVFSQYKKMPISY
jgi:hypothetical protein